MDFATNYVVVRDVTHAVILSSSGFILGPFVYYGHDGVGLFRPEEKRRAAGTAAVARTALISAETFCHSARHARA
jgi:hypothetical protein